MRSLVYGTILLVLVSACAGGEADRGGVSAGTEAAVPAVPETLARAEFKVEGMTCGGCIVGTRAALKKLDGVKDADASYEDSRAWALYDPSKVGPERMMAAIRELGYTPTLIEAKTRS